ncbi:hypothetical protein BDQ17DRAFT_1362299 [Cyathus striatus]|nr:hypothetical protein BDQ17DRAFT_1362299 [Cyathus striatus]
MALTIDSCHKCPLLSLRLTCVRWRDLMDRTPLLWSRFEVYGIPMINHTAITQRIQLCLERSGTSPLAISLLPSLATHGETLIVSRQAVENVVRHANRWISVIIQKQSLTNLKTLSLRCGRSIFPYFHIFRCASSIENLELNSLQIPQSYSQIPVAQLKRLAIVRCRWKGDTDIFISNLRSMTSLEELTWIDNSISFKHTNDLVVLPSLHSLSIMPMSNLEPLTGIWNILYTPSLTHLAVNLKSVNDKANVDSSVNTLLAMVSRSSCDINCRSILEELHNVQELSMQLLDLTSYTLISKLAWNPVKPCLLPSLRNLKISINLYKHSDPIIPSLMELMRSRSPGSSFNHTMSGCRNLLETLPEALLSFNCIVYVAPDHYRECIVAFEDLQKFGNERGIEVAVEVNERVLSYIDDDA